MDKFVKSRETLSLWPKAVNGLCNLYNRAIEISEEIATQMAVQRKAIHEKRSTHRFFIPLMRENKGYLQLLARDQFITKGLTGGKKTSEELGLTFDTIKKISRICSSRQDVPVRNKSKLCFDLTLFNKPFIVYSSAFPEGSTYGGWRPISKKEMKKI
jgi:hypothetical protein